MPRQKFAAFDSPESRRCSELADDGLRDLAEIPRSQENFGSLYVMQAKCGLIKVGRSVNPERRRRQLERLLGQPIAIVATFEGRGFDEERVLSGMTRKGFHNPPSEWFFCNDDLKTRLTKLLSFKIAHWPYRASWEKEHALVERLQSIELRNHLTNYRLKVIADLRTGAIFKYFSDESMRNFHIRSAISHEFCLLVVRGMRVEGARYQDPIPDYLGDPAVACTVGPDGWVPPEAKSTTDIIIAGLRARTKWERATEQY
jgi:hypothetical protein